MEWLTKQTKFEENYFIKEGDELQFKSIDFKKYYKLSYREIYVLVNEFHNLPLIHPNFAKTTLKLYDLAN